MKQGRVCEHTVESLRRQIEIHKILAPYLASADSARQLDEAWRTFETDATNLYRYTSSAGGGATIHKSTESAGVYDVAVEKALDDCRRCRVRVDEIYTGSHSAVLLGTSDDTHWTGADLELYKRGSR